MPKTPPPSPGGSFSDLYDAMQRKAPRTVRNGHHPTAEEAPAEPIAAAVPGPAPEQVIASREDDIASPPARKLASVLADMDEDVIARIRRTIRVVGKEVSFVRLTPAEKTELSDIVYAYKRRGQKTSETEINRIAVNYMIHDYKTNGAESVLARVLASLLS